MLSNETFLNIFNHCVFYLWIQAKMGLFSAAVIDTFPPRVESVACLHTHCQFGSISRDLQPAKTQYWQIRWAKLSRTPDNLEIGKKVGKWHFSSTKVTVCQKSLMITIFTSPHTRSKVNVKTALKLIFKNGKIYQNFAKWWFWRFWVASLALLFFTWFLNSVTWKDETYKLWRSFWPKKWVGKLVWLVKLV